MGRPCDLIRTHGIAVILIQRLYAMYNRNKTLLIILSTLLTMEVVSETIILGLIVADAQGQTSRSLMMRCKCSPVVSASCAVPPTLHM